MQFPDQVLSLAFLAESSVRLLLGVELDLRYNLLEPVDLSGMVRLHFLLVGDGHFVDAYDLIFFLLEFGLQIGNLVLKYGDLMTRKIQKLLYFTELLKSLLEVFELNLIFNIFTVSFSELSLDRFEA